MIEHTIAIGGVKLELTVPKGPKPEIIVWFHDCSGAQLEALADAVGPGALNPVGGADAYIITATLDDELAEFTIHAALAEDERPGRNAGTPLHPTIRRIHERQHGKPQSADEMFRG